MSALKTRKPTCKPSWPLILLAGESKTGKTYRSAEFTGDPRVGRAFWLDLGEGTADEYGAVPGAKYEIVDHDGTWVDIIAQVSAVKDLAVAELAAGKPPVVLVIDSMTAEWAMLTEWTNERAKRSKSNRALLESNPDAEIDVTSNYWNDANSRHNRLMNMLKTFPGIVVLTSLETEKTQFGPGGKPMAGAPKVAKPDGQKRLTSDVNVWVRLSLTDDPVIVGMRYPSKLNIIPGKPGRENQPKPFADFTIGKLVFDFLGIESAAVQVRDTPALDANQVLPEENPVKADESLARAKSKVWEFAQKLGWNADQLTADYAKTHEGAKLGAATATAVGEYAAELQQELEARDAKDSETTEPVAS